MPSPSLRILPIIVAFALSACASQNEPQPITVEPVLNKYGDVELCVGSDGTTYPPRPQLQNPCTPLDECPNPVQVPGTNVYVCEPPDDCPDGFIDTATGEFICPAPDRNTTGDSGRPSGSSSSSSSSSSDNSTSTPGTPTRP